MSERASAFSIKELSKCDLDTLENNCDDKDKKIIYDILMKNLKSCWVKID